MWFDIKKAKSNFLPSHTKLKRADGTKCTSNERPDILADHFEHKQWSIDENRERETLDAKIDNHMSARQNVPQKRRNRGNLVHYSRRDSVLDR